MMTINNAVEKCENCKFFKREETRRYGVCRRYPPRLVAADDPESDRHPNVVVTEWCGEYKSSVPCVEQTIQFNVGKRNPFMEPTREIMTVPIVCDPRMKVDDIEPLPSLNDWTNKRMTPEGIMIERVPGDPLPISQERTLTAEEEVKKRYPEANVFWSSIRCWVTNRRVSIERGMWESEETAWEQAWKFIQEEEANQEKS